MAVATGYDKLSRFMSNERYAIFRQFKSSAVRDLLYLQAELVQLEEEFSTISAQNRSIKGEQELYDRNWQVLSTSSNRDGGGQQWRKALEIREKLREYYECVARYSTIATMPQARKRDIAMLEDWIVRPDLGSGIPFSGSDLNPGQTSVYQEVHSGDLMTLSDRVGENDPFTRLLAGPIFHRLEKIWRFFKKPIPSDPENPQCESNLFHYSDSHILTAVDIAGTVTASMLPLLSIILLYFVHNLGLRLAVLCACTMAFSGSLAIVTKARRIEVFACTAA